MSEKLVPTTPKSPKSRSHDYALYHIHCTLKKYCHGGELPDPELFVETHFLEHYMGTRNFNCLTPEFGQFKRPDTGEDYHGLVLGFAAKHAEDRPSVQLAFVYPLSLDGRTLAPGGILTIIDFKDDNLIYFRREHEDPRTEWACNILARDMEDAAGNFIFDGDPVNW